MYMAMDQIGYLTIKFIKSMLEAIPVIEFSLVELLHGNASVEKITLTQSYSLYTYVLHLLSIVFMLMHFLKINGQGSLGLL